MIDLENIELISELITVRVKPHIYAFTTNTIPNYLKVGDTYRALTVRLNEWRKHFPNLQQVYSNPASIDDEIFFRDYAVHDFLIHEKGKYRLLIEDMVGFPPGTYYSKEFFKDTTKADVEEAIIDIQTSYKNNDNKYQFYNANTALPETYTYASTGYWTPRPNQQEAIDNFINAVDNGRTNLLMYAVMRFGKSFTAMCCAKAKNFKKVLVVSAKADVREEWKKTVQSADNFNQDYVFLSSEELLRDENIVSDTLASEKGIVLFLTLQDLQGTEIKTKHKSVFENELDLLIIDETHYGARAESYGRIIKTANTVKDITLNLSDDGDDSVDANIVDEQIKELNVRIKLHLSGTPYRILMGSEFSQEDIISFCQFSDIVAEQELWDKQHISYEDDKYIEEDEDKYQEWDNPYFGFPQMIRFAFTPNESALRILDSLKQNGSTYALSELLKPMSIKKTSDGDHKKFIHEKEVLDLFEAIDGSKDDESIFAFLDYDKIHEGKMCRHMVIVLPYCASCDALEELIITNKTSFKNLCNYEIINISGVDGARTYKTVQAIKDKIRNCEKSDKKTITLTVNRMLTGSTVEQWDTMIFLKDTSSPQEYDQAVFRLQNQYVQSYVDEEGKVIKFNMKPQTLLVDFDPHRMFIMQEQKSLIYNVNTDSSGNNHLRDRMASELKISPIITINKGKIQQVSATDIMAVVSEYSSSRGVKDEANDIPVDDNLFDIDEIKSEIERQAELGSKGGLKTEAHEGDGTGFDNTDENDGNSNANTTGTDSNGGNDDTAVSSTTDIENQIQILRNKFKTYYSRILFFAYLTEKKVTSLSDIIDISTESDSKRIMKNLDIDINILKLMVSHMYPFILTALDYKIQNINALSHDESIPAMERAITAMGKFGKLSESEITTPISVATKMIELIPDEAFSSLARDNHHILDIASKMGEFAIVIFNRCTSLGIDINLYKDKILSVPTSSIAYEFTRKIYSILGMDISCIAEQFTSYDLLSIVDNTQNVDYAHIQKILSQNKCFADISLECDAEEVETLKFNAIVGNPPYQEDDGGAGASARPLYPYFVNMAKNFSSEYSTLIIPSKWYAGGKGLDEFRDSMLHDIKIRELHDCIHPEDIFPDTNNRGGICYLLWDDKYNNTESINKIKIVTHEEAGKEYVDSRLLITRDLDIFIRNGKAISILDKVMPEDGTIKPLSDIISPRKPFGLEGNFVKDPGFHNSEDGLSTPIICYGKAKARGFIERSSVLSHAEWIDTWKVYMPYANNIGTELNDDNQNTFIGEPGSCCTETFLSVGHTLGLSETTAKNLSNYMRTKFARFLLSLAKISQHGTSKTYRFVPIVDFNEEWTDEKLYKKFGLSQEEINCIETSIKPM